MILINELTSERIDVPNDLFHAVDTAELIRAGKFTGVADIPAETYHAAPGMSYSALKELRKSPAHYQAYLRKEHDREVIGTGTHMRVLETERFERLIFRVVNRMSKENKAKEKEAEEAGLFVVTEKEYTQICRQSDAIMNDPDCRAYLSAGKAEQSIFWREPLVNLDTGEDLGESLLCRSRVDYLRDDGVMIDLKYFNSVEEEEVRKQVLRMKYHWQSAFYTKGGREVLGSGHDMFVHIFVTDSDPFVARPFVLGDASIDKARIEYTPLLIQFNECLRTNRWPAFERPAAGITQIELPDYAW